MNLLEIFTQLTHGELSQVSIGGQAQGQITENNYAQIVSHVNLGLAALYKRFPLKESRIKITLSDINTTYKIHSRHADSNVASFALKYINDSIEEPFNDDILKIERVYTEQGVELALNDPGDPYSVFTPSANVLSVPSIVKAELLTPVVDLVYRANHPLIVVGDGAFNPELVEVELPYSHLEPLLLYIASRFHNPIGMSNEFHAGNSYAAKYEQSCIQLELVNLRVDQSGEFDRLHAKGFV